MKTMFNFLAMVLFVVMFSNAWAFNLATVKEDTFYKDNFWAEVNPMEVNQLCGRYSKM